jgi:hypothetical protein
VSARRRGRRWRSVLALAAAVAIAAGGTAAIENARQPAGPASAAPSEVVQASNATLTSQVRYSATPWGGTAMKVSTMGLNPGTTCQFWVRNTAGKWSMAGRWTTGPGYGVHWYSVSSPVGASQLNEFRITSGGKILLDIPAS